MLLAASTALSKDMASYRKIWRFMMIAGASLTALHALIVFTPLYYVVTEGLLGAPAAIVEPARIGLAIMLPWTWTIAYRRFNQGVMIRFGHSRSVGAGTVVRLSAGMSVLLIGLAIGTIQGIVVATAAVAVGVTSEAIFAGRVVRPVLRNELALASPVEPALTYRVFFAFYIPLVLTSLLSLLAQPIGSAALSRMPQPVSSLAVWPVVTGLVFMVRSLGIAFNEVVVALLDEPGARPVLRRFTGILVAGTTAALLLHRGHAAEPVLVPGCLRPPARSCGARPHRPVDRAAAARAQRAAELVPGSDSAQPPHAQHHRGGRDLPRRRRRDPGCRGELGRRDWPVRGDGGDGGEHGRADGVAWGAIAALPAGRRLAYRPGRCVTRREGSGFLSARLTGYITPTF